MMARLGNVLYWIGTTVAALSLIVCGVSIVGVLLRGPIYGDWPYTITIWIFLLAAATVPYGIGLACRYILAGPKQNLQPEREPGTPLLRGLGSKQQLAEEFTAVLLDPDAREGLTQAIREGRGEVSAEQWDNIIHDLVERYKEIPSIKRRQP